MEEHLAPDLGDFVGRDEDPAVLDDVVSGEPLVEVRRAARPELDDDRRSAAALRVRRARRRGAVRLGGGHGRGGVRLRDRLRRGRVSDGRRVRRRRGAVRGRAGMRGPLARRAWVRGPLGRRAGVRGDRRVERLGLLPRGRGDGGRRCESGLVGHRHEHRRRRDRRRRGRHGVGRHGHGREGRRVNGGGRGRLHRRRRVHRRGSGRGGRRGGVHRRSHRGRGLHRSDGVGRHRDRREGRRGRDRLRDRRGERGRGERRGRGGRGGPLHRDGHRRLRDGRDGGPRRGGRDGRGRAGDGRRGLHGRGGDGLRCGGRSDGLQRRGAAGLVPSERVGLAQRGGDGFHDGVDGGVDRLDLLQPIEGAAHLGERFGAAFELRALGALDAVEDAHRFSDRVRHLHELVRHVRVVLQSVEGERELLSGGFCERYEVYDVRHGSPATRGAERVCARFHTAGSLSPLSPISHA